MINYCIDCGVNISVVSKRCYSCAQKNRFKNIKERNKISFANKGRIFSLKHRMKISIANKGNNNPFYGKHHSLISIKKMSLANSGKNHPLFGKHHSLETKKRISLSEKGKKISLETRKKISLVLKDLFKNPKNHPHYIDGRSFIDYPQAFDDKLKYKIRQRDNFECQNCNMTEEEHIVVNGQTLHIHHVDYNKMNTKDTNLISVCIQCNSRANFNRKFWHEHYAKKIYEIYK